MAEEQILATLVPLVSYLKPEKNTPGYYRSRLFSVHDELSPFVSAAGPIFSLLDRFSVAKNLPPIEKVLGNIEHELRAYQSRLQTQPYAEMQQAIAYYFMCVTIDEVLVRAYLRLYQRVPAFKAFTPALSPEDMPGKTFFSLLSYLKTRAYDQLPLLELAYYCLLAGFEGEQHGRADGRQVLDTEIDELFRLIQPYRQEIRIHLFERPKVLTQRFKFHRQFIMIGVGLAMLFSVLFALSQFFLEYQAKKIWFAPQVITTMDE